VRGKTVLFVGAGRHQRRAIGRVQELGVRVVAVDGNAEAPGLALADAGETVDGYEVYRYDDCAAVLRKKPKQVEPRPSHPHDPRIWWRAPCVDQTSPQVLFETRGGSMKVFG